MQPRKVGNLSQDRIFSKLTGQKREERLSGLSLHSIQLEVSRFQRKTCGDCRLWKAFRWPQRKDLLPLMGHSPSRESWIWTLGTEVHRPFRGHLWGQMADDQGPSLPQRYQGTDRIESWSTDVILGKKAPGITKLSNFLPSCGKGMESET